MRGEVRARGEGEVGVSGISKAEANGVAEKNNRESSPHG